HLAPANGFGDLAYTDHDESFLDVTAYYAAWFKTGTPPAIRQEKLYYVYRNRSKWQTAAYDVQKKAWTQLPDQIHDDVEDKVYATTFLRTPAELTIQSGANRKTFKLAAGISHVELPFGPGVPHFQLRRQGKVLADVSGNQQIVDTPTEENSRLGYRYANKTWSGAWCLGQGACEYSCAMATCYQGATVVTEGGRRVVHMPASDGNGLRLALPSLAGGAYNVRLRYRNVQPNECRLSLTAAGATSNLFPVFLPPTASGAWHTVAFLWTLPDACTSLTLERKKGDLGEAFLDSIELAPVLPIVATPTPASTLPALTEIPGGAFRMGAEHGDPDEVPLHPVTVSPFRMGKCEVTNAEYERLAPEHKRYRDEYSWRDSDPVTYISWQQAALYCNWLSAQAGLSPAYNPKDWSVNLHAGYRLPTEAEWEYVASGRGEGRRYPWGKVAPDASRCNATGPGAMAVGSYPAGASRDGIMDLAGNVAEWCTDMYHAYTSAAVTDPCDLQPGPYRVIRGGSWGYYNRSQRVADREFNTQVYPGFYYVGFRVVLPHAAAPAQ
ncbi:MAG TPA: endo-1,3-alpha-glucanase family glycosylhydrolase, partial [Armatimonadota bacterium]